MILGYNTNGLAHHRLDDGLRLLADEGFGAVALTPDVAHLDPYRSTAAEVERIAALLARLDMTCVVEAGARYLLDSQRKHTFFVRFAGGCPLASSSSPPSITRACKRSVLGAYSRPDSRNP